MALPKKKKEPAPWRAGILNHHKRNKPKRGDYTKVTAAVRKEVDRRSMERWHSNVACCERCGTIHNLTKAHIQNASQMGSGSDPRNIMNLCGTHGWTGSCHDYCDNVRAGLVFKRQYGEFLQQYYTEKPWKDDNNERV